MITVGARCDHLLTFSTTLLILLGNPLGLIRQRFPGVDSGQKRVAFGSKARWIRFKGANFLAKGALTSSLAHASNGNGRSIVTVLFSLASVIWRTSTDLGV